jgi:transcriptional regulator NrdR family protein
MPQPEAALPETRDRRCPTCQSEQTVQEGRVEAAGKIIKPERRCEACGARFVFVRNTII